MKAARWSTLAGATVAVALLTVAAVWALNRPDAGEPPPPPPATAEARAALLARGAQLALAGNCAGCHAGSDGTPYAGGQPVHTPFGTVYASNLTPDAATGLGAWSADDFWQALHNGRSRDGRVLTPAFPYTAYTRVPRADAEALWAYLQSLPPVERATPPNALRWGLGSTPALMAWRAAYFRPGALPAVAGASAEWLRGRELVEGLAHCQGCHGSRNVLGGPSGANDGAVMPDGRWYAPPLAGGPGQAERVLALLRDGQHADGIANGPMADVVAESTRHLPEADLRAMAVYVASLPAAPLLAKRAEPAPGVVLEAGAALYKQHCADCHGEDGRSPHPELFPSLLDRPALRQPNALNVVQVVLRGGYAPATAAHPRPAGMPPFAGVLNDEEVAAVVSHLRHRFAGGAAPVGPLEVQRAR